MKTIIVFLIIIELLWEFRKGDRHGVGSALFVASMFVVSAIIGNAFGRVDVVFNRYPIEHDTTVAFVACVYYLTCRWSIFSPTMSWLKHGHLKYLGSNTIDELEKTVNSNVLLVLRLVVFLTFIIL